MPSPGVVDVRIPLDVYPLHYNLELKPDIYTGNPDTFRFDGRVEILLDYISSREQAQHLDQ